MVFFKVTDGVQTRILQAKYGEISYQELKERLASLFPEIMKEDGDMILRYYDKEGDLITLSSDEELQEAFSGIPESKVIKFYLSWPVSRRSRCNGVTRNAKGLFSLHYLLKPSWCYSLGSFADLIENEISPLMESLHNLTPSPVTDAHDKETPGIAGSDGTGSISQDEESCRNHQEEQIRGAQVGKEEEKENSRSAANESVNVCKDSVHCHMKSLHEVGPDFLGESLFGPADLGLFGNPVGYRISWGLRPTYIFSH